METKSERHKLANAQKAAAGKPHGSRRPYGYEADLITIYKPEAAILREMGRRIMAGHGFKEVAYWLNEQGHTTTTGKLWYPLTVRNMLLKPRYGGIRTYNGAEYPAVGDVNPNWPHRDGGGWPQPRVGASCRRLAALEVTPRRCRWGRGRSR